MAFPHGETVVIKRQEQTGVDRYGNPVFSWTETPVPGCAIAPGTSLEPAQVDRSEVITGWLVYFPPLTDVRASDRLVARGRELEVDGEPGDWRNPYTGRAHGVVAATKEVTG